jgi:NAD(P) transhydrogenase
MPYEVGVVPVPRAGRGQIAGDSYGMLKLLVSTRNLKLLGVHIFGSKPPRWCTSARP